jgi:hypothetical protein
MGEALSHPSTHAALLEYLRTLALTEGTRMPDNAGDMRIVWQAGRKAGLAEAALQIEGLVVPKEAPDAA